METVQHYGKTSQKELPLLRGASGNHYEYGYGVRVITNHHAGRQNPCARPESYGYRRTQDQNTRPGGETVVLVATTTTSESRTELRVGFRQHADIGNA
eukprot:scaffold68895_cov35-Prasinocladus_malaysianus.AAC.2